MDDPELAYIVTRAREVHDFWHVLFDCHTNVFGELVLKALEAVQVNPSLRGLRQGRLRGAGLSARGTRERHRRAWQESGGRKEEGGGAPGGGMRR